MDTRDTGLPRWTRIVIYGVAIAAFFWIVPAIREPERLKIFAPAAIGLFLLEGVVSHVRERGLHWKLRLPFWAHVGLYYALAIAFVLTLPSLRQLHPAAM